MEVQELQGDVLPHLPAVTPMPTVSGAVAERPGTVHRVGINKGLEICWIFDESRIRVWAEVGGYQAGRSYEVTFKKPSIRIEDSVILAKWGIVATGVWKNERPVNLHLEGHVCGRPTPVSHWQCKSVKV